MAVLQIFHVNKDETLPTPVRENTPVKSAGGVVSQGPGDCEEAGLDSVGGA